MASTIFETMKIAIAEYRATSISRKTMTAKVTTEVSMQSISIPVRRFGKILRSSSARRSVPPVLMPRCSSNPAPMPVNVPPAIAASRGLLEYAGSSIPNTSTSTETEPVAASVMMSARRLNLRHAASSSGVLSMTIQTPTLMGGNTAASAVERPATPPGAISFGTLNTAIAAEMSGQANRTVKTSSRASLFFCCCAVSFALFISHAPSLFY